MTIKLLFEHIPLMLLIGVVCFLILMTIIFVGSVSPTYSVWYKIADRLDKFANVALTVFGIIGFGELLMVIYVFTQLFKYGGN